MKSPIVRDGILVGLYTNRETAHLVGERSWWVRRFD
jgi:predicted Zn-dependent protease